jgi:hypothetical protein
MQQARTLLSGAEVLAFARIFFARRSGIYSAFLEQEGPAFLTLRGLGGEEIAIAVTAAGGVTTVTGSSYMFDAQVARFLSSLPPATMEGMS